MEDSIRHALSHEILEHKSKHTLIMVLIKTLHKSIRKSILGKFPRSSTHKLSTTWKNNIGINLTQRTLKHGRRLTHVKITFLMHHMHTKLDRVRGTITTLEYLLRERVLV